MKSKKILFIIVLFTCITSSIYACDICGCGLGNYYIGLVPQFNKKFIGLRYQYHTFHTQLASDKSQYSNDYFQSVELWSGINIGKRWQVLVFVPYSFNRQVSDDGIKTSHGLGDVAAIANYSLLETSSLNKNNKMVFQQLWVGGGIKLPTGRADIDPNADDLVALANSQLGSGSTDFMLNAAYSLHVDKIGVSTNLTYKINTANKDSYRFGNRLSSNSFVSYSIKAKAVVLTPNAGILYEKMAVNQLKGAKVDQTGGYGASGAVGLEISAGKTSIGFNVQAPIAQNFSDGQTKSKLGGMMHVTLAL